MESFFSDGSLLIFIVGACVGSFLNVCIVRMPKGQSVVFPRSRCACGAPIPFYRNIPIVSWMALRGKAACCKRRISPMYIIVEILTAILFVALWKVNEPSLFIAYAVFVSIGIVASAIDLSSMEIPDSLSIGLLIAGFVFSFNPLLHDATTHLLSLKDAFFGACMASGLLLWIAIFAEYAFKQEALGGGDIKWIAGLGAFLGPKGALFALFGGATWGCAILLPLLVYSAFKKDKKLTLLSRVPFGPFLTLGALTYLFFHERIDIYFSALDSLTYLY